VTIHAEYIKKESESPQFKTQEVINKLGYTEEEQTQILELHNRVRAEGDESLEAFPSFESLVHTGINFAFQFLEENPIVSIERLQRIDPEAAQLFLQDLVEEDKKDSDIIIVQD
jgi:hypothetical protein